MLLVVWQQSGISGFWSQHRPHVAEQQNAANCYRTHNALQKRWSVPLFYEGVYRCKPLKQTQDCLSLYKCPSRWSLDNHTFYSCDMCTVLIMSAAVFTNTELFRVQTWTLL